ncbi:hypothetical protein GCM10022224_080900 [Nonomuraea antimicrobica]|uniref:Uncharacterized protein n=1 Tax=Nonomuraea antimicrobica TaxID=561173 RepID=A0ABP7DDU2_9ACTN
MTATESFPLFIIGRDTGPAGRIFRLLAGLAGLGLLAHRLTGATLGYIGLVVVFFLLLVAAYAAFWRLLADRFIARVSPWVTSALLLLPVMAYATDPGGSAFFNGIAGYLSTSLIVNAASGYGGVEAAAIPAVLWRRRYPTYSPFNTVDLLERAYRERSPGAASAVATVVSATISALVFAAYWLVPLLAYLPSVASFGEDLPGVAAAVLLVPAALFGYEALRRRSATARFDPVQGTAAGAALLLTPAFVVLSDQGGGPQGILWGLITLVGLIVGVVALVRRLVSGRVVGEKAEPSPSATPSAGGPSQ